MSVHDEMADLTAYVKPRPRVIRVIHAESGQVSNEIPIPDEKSLSEIDRWVSWLETTCGPDYEIEAA